MDVRQYFNKQLETARPLTLAQVEEMRDARRKTLTPEQYEVSLKATRLDTDELVGHIMLFYMLRTQDQNPAEGFDRSVKIEVLRIVDDELDQLDGRVRFDRMSDKIPVFEAV